MVRLDVKNLAGEAAVLSGAGPGRQLLTRLIDATPATMTVMPVLLDFSGVQVATSSFLRESVIAFRDYARTSLSQVYPVVANAGPAVLEELNFFIRQRGDALWHCILNEDGTISGASILGDLDPAQRATFDLVVQMGRTSAPELAAQDGAIGQTAWSNRLSWLSTKGLIAEHRLGKTKLFTPLLEIA